jgi:UDP-N-acetylglucosamine 3-dehydrogenase
MTLGSSSPALRGAVIGLGMIGRHHARLLQASERVEFAGAVDGEGDRYASVHDPDLVFGSVAGPLARWTSRSSLCPPTVTCRWPVN